MAAPKKVNRIASRRVLTKWLVTIRSSLDLTFGLGSIRAWSQAVSHRENPEARLLPLARHFDISRNMEASLPYTAAIAALASLAQEHRLALFRLLVQAGPDGMAAGALAEALGVPNSSLSFHLAHLTRAGLIEQQRQGRSLIYTANYDAMNALVGFLTENCCGGATCAPASTETATKRKSA
jgi:DNA-binding transcriptional ArsR family regulator